MHQAEIERLLSAYPDLLTVSEAAAVLRVPHARYSVGRGTDDSPPSVLVAPIVSHARMWF
jgi:hypothetical protein